MNPHVSTQQKMPIPPEVLREQRYKAWLSGLRLSGPEVMEQMFRNGSDRKPNPYFDGRKKPVG